MLRGEMRLTDLDPARGSEADKRRPAIIVSNDRANTSAGPLGVWRGDRGSGHQHRHADLSVPDTSAGRQGTGLRVASKAQAEQVRSVSIERIGPVLGRVPPSVMAELDEALRLHLQF